MNWHLHGRYTSFEPGHKLAFTWHWDQEPENTSGTAVTVTFSSLAKFIGKRYNTGRFIIPAVGTQGYV
jgi:uncharacterized protein YndB with AHSA1/START domain